MARAQSYATRQLNNMEPYYFTLVALAPKTNRSSPSRPPHTCAASSELLLANFAFFLSAFRPNLGENRGEGPAGSGWGV